MSKRTTIELGQEAEALKNNRAMQEILSRMEADVAARRKAMPPHRTDLIGVVFQQEQVLDAFKSALEALIYEGQTAQREWADLQAKREGRMERLRRVL